MSELTAAISIGKLAMNFVFDQYTQRQRSRAESRVDDLIGNLYSAGHFSSEVPPRVAIEQLLSTEEDTRLLEEAIKASLSTISDEALPYLTSLYVDYTHERRPYDSFYRRTASMLCNLDRIEVQAIQRLFAALRGQLDRVLENQVNAALRFGLSEDRLSIEWENDAAGVVGSRAMSAAMPRFDGVEVAIQVLLRSGILVLSDVNGYLDAKQSPANTTAQGSGVRELVMLARLFWKVDNRPSLA